VRDSKLGLPDEVMGPDVLVEAAHLELVAHRFNLELEVVIPDGLLSTTLNDLSFVFHAIIFYLNEWIHFANKFRIAQELARAYLDVKDTSSSGCGNISLA
jgi:hypothetical protein